MEIKKIELVLVQNGFRLEEIRNMELWEINAYLDIISEMMKDEGGSG